MKMIISLVIAALLTGPALLPAQEPTASPETHAAPAAEPATPPPKPEQAAPPKDEPSPKTENAPDSSNNGQIHIKFDSWDFHWAPDPGTPFERLGRFSYAFWLSPFMLLWRSGLLVLWVALSCAVAALFQPAILRVQAELRAAPERSVALGFLWTMLYWMLFGGCLLLSMFLVGVPLLILLVAFDLALNVFGMTVTFVVFGEWIARRLNRSEASIYAAVFIGACALGLLRLIPFVGSFLWLGASLFGIGATLAARFGTAGAPPALNSPDGPAPLTA